MIKQSGRRLCERRLGCPTGGPRAYGRMRPATYSNPACDAGKIYSPVGKFAERAKLAIIV